MRRGLARKKWILTKIISRCLAVTYVNARAERNLVFRAKRVDWAKGEGLWKAKATGEKAAF
jgi:hypothetical protein